MDMKLRVYHSFWSVPLITRRFNWNIRYRAEQMLVMAALGCIAGKSYGCEFVLHTDEKGLRLFDCIPYDDIYTTVEKNTLPKIFWASPKFIALEHEPVGTVHLDIDAFIQSRNCVNVLSESNADIVVQNREFGFECYEGQNSFVARYINTKGTEIENVDFRNWDAFNCGLVKINNEKLKEVYLRLYWQFAQEIAGKGMEDGWAKQSYCIPDITLEQWMLHKLVTGGNYSCHEIIGEHGEGAKELGYCHLIGDAKNAASIQEAGSILKNMCFPLYEAILKKLDNLDAILGIG